MSQIKRYRKKRIESKQKTDNFKSAILKLSLIMFNFMFATFAWFTYTKILNPAVDVNVSAWQIDFKDDNPTNDVLGTSMEFQVGKFYPGMADYTKEIEIINLGDRDASISYKISALKILGEEYTIKTTPEEGDSEEDKIVYKSETVDATTGEKTIKLLNDSAKYPFEIIITHSDEIGIANPSDENNNKGNFKIRFTWPYVLIVPEGETATEEQITQKNTLDTKWGHDIANFYEQEGDSAKGIEIQIQAIASQII